MSSSLILKLQEVNKSISTLEIQPIINESKVTVGWNCYFLNNDGKTIAGGTAESLDTAKRIAIAECFERALFDKIFSNEAAVASLLLNISPSTSGFAVGFDKESTAFRSQCEAIERWAWSQWIDYSYKNIELFQTPKLSILANHLLKKFDNYRFFSKILPIKFNHAFPNSVEFSVFLGIKNNGVFAGSRVTTSLDNPWEYAIIEAYRNFNNYQLSDKAINPESSIIAQRVNYFGSNYVSANEQIDRAKISVWPTTELKIHTEVNTGIESLYMFRSLCKDYYHWHLGDYKRFVY